MTDLPETEKPKARKKRKTASQHRKESSERVMAWRRKLQDKGYKAHNILLSPQAQEIIASQKEIYPKITVPEILEKALVALREVEALLPPPVEPPDPIENLKAILAGKAAAQPKAQPQAKAKPNLSAPLQKPMEQALAETYAELVRLKEAGVRIRTLPTIE